MGSESNQNHNRAIFAQVFTQRTLKWAISPITATFSPTHCAHCMCQGLLNTCTNHSVLYQTGPQQWDKDEWQHFSSPCLLLHFSSPWSTMSPKWGLDQGLSTGGMHTSAGTWEDPRGYTAVAWRSEGTWEAHHHMAVCFPSNPASPAAATCNHLPPSRYPSPAHRLAVGGISLPLLVNQPLGQPQPHLSTTCWEPPHLSIGCGGPLCSSRGYSRGGTNRRGTLLK